MAASRTHPGILWIHNDSGHEPYVYATGFDGVVVAVFDVRSARARDWEDIALGVCPPDLFDDTSTSDCLYIADTGDNNRQRNSVSIYVVPEPDPALSRSDTVVKTERAHRVRFEYRRDRAYDVEALAVSPVGDLTLISKGRRPGAGIVEFRIPADEVTEDETRARTVGQLPIDPVRHLGRWVTGAAISPSGRRLVVRTYTELYLFDRDADGTLHPHPPVCWVGAAEPQGEAVDWLDEEELVLVSESVAGRPGTIYRARCTEH